MASGKTVALVLCIAVIGMSKLVDHEQAKSGFACCPDTYAWDHHTLSCVCPANAQYVTADNRCVSCARPHYWDAASKQCLTCPHNTIYNEKDKKC